MSPKAKHAAEPAAKASADGDEEDVEEEQAGGSKEQRREGGDVSKLTDYVPQREIDSDRATQAVASIADDAQTAAEREAEAAREKELAAVAVDAADVALVASEMECAACPAQQQPHYTLRASPQPH